MDDLTIKTSTVRDGVSPATTGRDGLTGLAGLAVSFQDMLQRAGIRLENGFLAIVDRAGIGAAADRKEPEKPANDDHRRQADDGQDRVNSRDRAADDRSDQSRSRPADRQDDHGRDHGAERRDAHADDAGRDHADSRGDNRAGERADKGSDNDQTSAKDDGGHEGKAEAGDNADKSAGKSKHSKGDAKSGDHQSGGQDGNAVVANADAAAAQAGVAQQLLNPLLAGLLVAGDAKGANEGPADVAGNVSATGTENMAQTAIENIAKVTPVSTGKDGGPQDNHKGHAQAFAHAASQAKTQAAEQSAVNVEAETAVDAKPVETQAAALSKMLGDGNKTQVSVTVANEAETLTSRPTATLTSGSVISSDAGQSSRQSGNAQAQTAAHNPVVATQAAQSSGGPAQNEGAQNSQGLQTAQANTDAKGLVQATAASGNSGGTAHSGGGEAGMQGNSGSANASQQASQVQQQAQADKAQNAEKPSRPGHAAFEQVVVKITKAIAAGNDKITIQLRPANMGRVEVKMELTHDNRLMAVVTADNKDTLQALQRDARELQRALADAGLHTGNGDLHFNLRGETGQGTDGDGKSAGKLFIEDDAADAKDMGPADGLFPVRDGIYVNGRIDVRA